MLYSLAHFETDDGQAGELTTNVKRALWNAMVVYCETRWLRSILVEMYRRIRLNLPSHPLSKDHWGLIHSWTNLCTYVLSQRLEGNLKLETPLPIWISEHHAFKTMDGLIGIYSELLMIKLDKFQVGKSVEEFLLHWRMPRAWNVPEPGIQMQLWFLS